MKFTCFDLRLFMDETSIHELVHRKYMWQKKSSGIFWGKIFIIMLGIIIFLHGNFIFSCMKMKSLCHDSFMHETFPMGVRFTMLLAYLEGIRFIVLYPPKCSHDLPPLAGLYTQKPFITVVSSLRLLSVSLL